VGNVLITGLTNHSAMPERHAMVEIKFGWSVERRGLIVRQWRGGISASELCCSCNIALCLMEALCQPHSRTVRNSRRGRRHDPVDGIMTATPTSPMPLRRSCIHSQVFEYEYA